METGMNGDNGHWVVDISLKGIRWLACFLFIVQPMHPLLSFFSLCNPMLFYHSIRLWVHKVSFIWVCHQFPLDCFYVLCVLTTHKIVDPNFKLKNINSPLIKRQCIAFSAKYQKKTNVRRFSDIFLWPSIRMCPRSCKHCCILLIKICSSVVISEKKGK